MSPAVQAVIIDSAAAVIMLKPGETKTLLCFANQHFLPGIKSHLQHANRVDII